MFIPVGPFEASLIIYLDGQPLIARTGETVAACLMRANTESFRTTPVTESARLPYCMIGHCFDCLVEIDGRGNQQACLALVRDGMKVRRQSGAADVIEVLQ